MTTPKWQPGHTYLPGDLVQPLQAAPLAPTALTNPDFETGVITGWTVTQFGGTGTASVSTGRKYTGTYAGFWQGAVGTGHASGVEADWINDTEVPVKPGQSASATIYLALDDADDSQSQAEARLYWYDASHTLLSHSSGTLLHGNDAAWRQCTVTGTAPAGAAFARMGAWTTANTHGGVRLDNATWNIVAAGGVAGLIYKAVQTGAGVSDSTEPAWPNVNGDTVVDNTVTWEAVIASRVVWEASSICTSGATEPDWPTTPGAFVSDGTVSWECISRRVEDENCPNTKVVAIMAGKVFAVDKDIVRFSATANPLDWSSERDAGFLPTGLQQANANDMAVLAPYRSNLAAFNASGFQLWQVDPDPEAMAQLDQMEGIGSTWPLAAVPVANDLLFLTKLGVRSVSIAAGGENLAAGDVGMPIDPLIQAAMVSGARPIATWYPGAGQYWLTFPTQPNPYAPSIAGDLPDGTVGDSDTYQYVLSGGVAPLVASIYAGSLPPGATMNRHGLVTYTYTTAGSYSWTVRVTDAAGNHADLPDTATVVAASGSSFVLTGQSATILVNSGDPAVAADWQAAGVTTYTGQVFRAAGGDGVYVAAARVGSYVLRSTDKLNWSQVAIGGTGDNTMVVGYHAGTFILGDDAGGIYSSPDGTTWTLNPTSGFGFYFAGWVNDRFILGDAFGKVYTSPDGLTWSGPYTATSDDVQGVAYGAGKFVAVGGYGKISTSADGVTWTARTSGLTSGQHVHGIAYGNGTFVAAVAGGVVATSTDGINWTNATVPGHAGAFGDVVFDGGVFVLVHSDYSGTATTKLAVSSDGGSWADVALGALSTSGSLPFVGLAAI